jgi:hypothetical protein
MKSFALFIFSCTALFAAASDGLKFYAVTALRLTTGPTDVNTMDGKETVGKGKYILEIQGALRNTGNKEIVVATECDTSGTLNGGVCNYSVDMKGVDQKPSKPSLYSLRPVTLKPGELTSLPAVDYPLDNLSEIPARIIVLYSVDEDFHMFYPDLWVGDLTFETKAPSLSH